MGLSHAEEQLRDRFLQTLLETARTLQRESGSDTEVALEALIDATDLLRDRLEQELAGLRVEQAE